MKSSSSDVDYALDELTADNIELIYNWLPEPFDRDAEVFMRTFILAEALGARLLAELVLAFGSHEHVAFAAGLARRALDELAHMATTRQGQYRPSALTQRHVFQRLIGESDLKLRSARSLAFDRYEETWQKICRDELITPVAQAELRSLATYITGISVDIVTAAFRYGGGGALFQPNIFERLLRDMNAAAQHIMTSDLAYEVHGKFLLDLADADPID